MKTNDLAKLAKTLEALQRSLQWVEDVELETFDSTLQVKMPLDETYLVLSGMADFNARLVDSFGDTGTIRMEIK